MGISRTSLILSANRALLGEVRPNMRSVYVDYKSKENKVVVYFYYDTPPTEEELDYDVEGTIMVEMIASYSDDVEWEDKSCIMPYPQIITPPSEVCVYRRYEKKFEG